MVALHAKTRAVPAPYVVAINLTRRCNLACAHCYLESRHRRDGGAEELTTHDVTVLLDDIASLGGETMVVLSGGEPLLRPDLEALARHAANRGLMVVVGSNGIGLTNRRVERLKRAGVCGVGISLDSLDAARHDRFRGVAGAWERTMAGIDACRHNGLAHQIHFSVTDENAPELDAMIEFARNSGAVALNIFFLVCTGRGERVTNISAASYETVLRRVTRAAREENGLLVRAKCAPHFKRMAMELDPSWPITVAHGYEAGGCLAGTRYCRVTPEGDVTACPYIEQSAGSVRTRRLAEIWESAPMFETLRAPVLKGRCGACEFRKLCGGCRARPLARDGDVMGEDFLCDYQPTGAALIEPLPVREQRLVWTNEAERRMSRVPPFLRRFVRARAESHVRAQQGNVVTAEVLDALARRRFGRTLSSSSAAPEHREPPRRAR